MLAVAQEAPVLVGNVLFGADEFVAEFVRVRMPIARANFNPCTALGVVLKGQLVGGVVFHNYVGFNLEVSLAFDHPGWASRKTLRTLFGYPFLQLGCLRITCVTGKRNRKTRRLIVGCGWKQEGVHPKALDGMDCAISYGMMRDQCKWIAPKSTEGHAIRHG